MRAKLILILLALLIVGGVADVFAAASINVVPSKVPKGAYYNSSTDNNLFWQRIVLTLNEYTANAAGTVTIVLPTDLDIPVMSNDGNFDKEITFTYKLSNSDGSTAITLDATTTKDQIVLKHDSVGANKGLANGDSIIVMFPVTLSGATIPSTGEYTVAFSQGASMDITAGNGPTITYVDPGATAVQFIDFAAILSGNDDTTSDEGEVYPTTLAAGALYDALPDLAIVCTSGGVTGLHYYKYSTDVIFT